MPTGIKRGLNSQPNTSQMTLILVGFSSLVSQVARYLESVTSRDKFLLHHIAVANCFPHLYYVFLLV